LGEKKDKLDAVKARIKQLFLNYCDFSVETGQVYISYNNFMKMMENA
jgi:hypothetical protein